jgi:hypothetical protein
VGENVQEVVAMLWGNGVAAVVAMSIVDDAVELACRGLFAERVMRRTWRVVVQRVSEADRGGRG